LFLFILRRFLVSIPLLFVASIIVFVMVINLGTPQKLEDAIAKPNAKPATIASIRRQFELDKAPVERYTSWITGFVQGDFGLDGERTDVRSDIWRAIQVTVRLLIFAQVVSVLLGLIVGVTSAIRQYTAFDYLSTGFAFFFFSIPTAVLAGFLKFFGIIGFNKWARHPTMSPTVLIVLLVLGLLCGYGVMRNRRKFDPVRQLNKLALGAAAGVGVALAFILVFKWGWDGEVYRKRTPSGIIATLGQASARPPEDFFMRMQDYFWHLLGPSLTLTLVGFAGYSRYMRASMLDQMTSDYVRTARAKGAGEGRVIVRHAMRNALIPLTTAIALDFGTLLSGAIITERIFAWKGMGSFFTEALSKREPYPLLAFVMITALMVVLFNLIADILYAYLDPRIRLD